MTEGMWMALLGAMGPVALGLINMVGSVAMLWIRAHYGYRDSINGSQATAGPASPNPLPPAPPAPH